MLAKRTDWKKLAATNRKMFKLGEAMWAKIAAEREEARNDRVGKPGRRTFKVKVRQN